MMNIPDQFQIKKTISQNTYLVDGVLKTWTGETADVYSTISQQIHINQHYWALFLS